MINTYDLNKYLRDVKEKLTCNRQEKNRVISDLQKSIDSLVDENPQLTMEDVIQKFGDPEEIASSFITFDSSETIHEQVRNKKRTTKVVVGIAISLAAIIILIFCIMLADSLSFNRGYFKEGSAEHNSESSQSGEVY